jgi:outer membrane lipoprotein-sorting protein
MTAEHLLCLLLLTLTLPGCQEKTAKAVADTIAVKVADNVTKFHKLKKLSVVGDFDGDGKQDSVFQHTYSRQAQSEIDYSPDPLQNEWDTVAQWFYDQKADVYLTLHQNNPDTLHLGTAQGLYCLFTIGDTNADGKDEIALVVDQLDFSRVNSCLIYSLCKGKWTLLKQFGVYEGAFDFTSDQSPVFNTIKGFLEKQDDHWVYKDYSQLMEDNDPGKMLILKLAPCK